MTKKNHSLKEKFGQWILLLSCLLTGFAAQAQLKVGDNPTTLNPNALLEVEGTNKGFLLPRVALSLTTSFSPLTAHVQGMMVYNTATAGDVSPGFYYNDGTKWNRIASPGATTNSLTTSGGGISSSVNGVVSTLTPASGIIANGSTLGFDVSGNLVKGVGVGNSSDSTTSSNGLTMTGKDVRLGGTLTSATTITTSASNTLNLLGLQNSIASTDSILVVDASGAIKKRSVQSVSDRTLSVRTETGSYTAQLTDDIIIYNGSTGGLTLTLPTSGVSVGKTFFVANISNQDWQLSPTPLNGGLVTCQAQVGTVLMYVGSGWVTINAY